jgi:O-methyltransferase
MASIKSTLFKIRWFLNNYRKINTESILIPNNFLGPVNYVKDSVATSNNCDFLEDLRFKKAYELARATSPWKGFEMQWRTYIICCLAEMVKKLPGDFVECGVNTGAYSRALIDYIDFNSTGKTFYLFDTYEGLVPSQITEEEKISGVAGYLSTYTNVYDQVVETFSPFRTKIIRGMVPDTLPQYDADKVCYLSIDMNVVAPEIAAAHYFWDKLVSGAVMVLDDYGFPAHIAQKKAFDAFAKEKNVPLIYIPTGQAIIFKP